MTSSDTEMIPKKKMYEMRITPILERILKQMNVHLKDEQKEKLIHFLLSQLPLSKLMSFSDVTIRYKILDLLDNQEILLMISSASSLKLKKRSSFDIRHKETIRLFLKEYFQLFFPNLAGFMNFESVQFKDKELISLFGDHENPEQLKIADLLIMIQILMDNNPEWIMIHWEQQSEKQAHFEERMFHLFSGIYYQFRKIVFPIAMFTDNARWTKPVLKTYKMALHEFSINEFSFQLIKLKDFNSEEFEKKAPDNPLTWAYLPLTYYPNDKRVNIKAKAVNGIAKTAKTEKGKATLFSLVNHTLRLTPEEQKVYNNIIEKDLIYKEGKMLESIKEVGIEEGIEIGIEKGIEKGRIGMTEMLLMNIKFRFGFISTEIEEKINSIKNMDKIRELYTQSFSCENETQFNQLLD